MSTSQNGWSVSPTRNKEWSVHGVSFPDGVRTGDVSTVLGYVVTQFHERVEKLIEGECWGYANRPIRGQTTGYSNHASATAVDVNAPKHPRGSVGTFSKKQAAEIRQILDEVDNVVRWGGDYTSGPHDEMHFEINANATKVAAVAKKLKGATMALDKDVEQRFDDLEKAHANTQGRVQKVLDRVEKYLNSRTDEDLNVDRDQTKKLDKLTTELAEIKTTVEEILDRMDDTDDESDV
jgi:ElaB/YqjD/DUF883 family membrane-anchored ribosome-binding protein